MRCQVDTAELAGLLDRLSTVGVRSLIWRVLGGAIVQILAAFVMVGIVVAVFGLAPRLTTATWAAFVTFLLFGEFGSLFELPGWMMDLSPFTHTPRIPGEALEIVPLLGLLAVAAALLGIGTVAFRRRDVG